MNAMPPPSVAAVASLRARLWDRGFRPVALQTGDKMPLAREWQELARRDPPFDAVTPPRSDRLNTGLLADGLRAIDIDVDEAGIVAEVRMLATVMLGSTPCVRTRANSPRCAMLYRAAEGEPRKQHRAGTNGKVEVLGRGQQLHAFGLHPSGVELTWLPRVPGDAARTDLPVVTEMQVGEFLTALERLIESRNQTPPRADKSSSDHQPSMLGQTAKQLDVAAALDVIPNDGPADWEHWNRVAMATYAATNGSKSGFASWLAWSEKHPTHDDDMAEARWKSIKASPPDEIGAGTLFRMAVEACPGWTKPSERAANREAPRDPKRPLFRAVSLAEAFPVNALGALRGATEAIRQRTQAPMAICAQSVLAAATLAVQAHRDVELPGAGRRPLTGLFACVAESGERKTSVDRIALAPVYQVEAQWREAREAELNAFANDHEAWKAAREACKKRNKGDRDAIREALNTIGREPKPPPQAMLLVEDFSPEALALHLQHGRPWAGVFTSEGGVLVGGHAFSDEKTMATGALLNSLWDGAAIRRSRVLTGTAFLPGRRCSTHIMMQRVVAHRLLGDAVLDGIGTTARMLIVEPESTVGTRLYREPPAGCAEALRFYGDRMIHLLTRRLPTSPDSPDVLDPPVMTLTPEARRLWVEFHDEIERDLAPGGELHAVRAFGAKMAEHAGRLAAVLTAYEAPEAMEVGEVAMACGITLAQHYAKEMLRLRDAAAVSPDLQLAARLLEWWQARPDPQCHLAAIYQRGPGAVRDAATARRITGMLEEHGWVRRLPAGTELDGAGRRDAWELVP